MGAKQQEGARSRNDDQHRHTCLPSRHPNATFQYNLPRTHLFPYYMTGHQNTCLTFVYFDSFTPAFDNTHPLTLFFPFSCAYLPLAFITVAIKVDASSCPMSLSPSINGACITEEETRAEIGEKKGGKGAWGGGRASKRGPQ